MKSILYLNRLLNIDELLFISQNSQLVAPKSHLYVFEIEFRTIIADCLFYFIF